MPSSIPRDRLGKRDEESLALDHSREEVSKDNTPEEWQVTGAGSWTGWKYDSL